MAVSGTHVSDAREIFYIKGALEAILPRCGTYYISDESIPPLDTATRLLISSKAETASSHGLRVVAMAYGFGSVSSLEKNGIESAATSPPQQNLVYVGFQAMMDPPRRGVSDAVSSLHSGGIQVIMITGDAVETALAIARQLGLLVHTKSASYANGYDIELLERRNTGHGDARAGCLTGKEIDLMDDRMLIERVRGVTVFARTTPRHKMRIVSALQSRGAIVAMTGDGGE